MMNSDRQNEKSFFGLIIAGMNGIGSLLIIVITALICADIVGRSVFGTPVAGVAEMVSLTIVAVVFLQLGQAVRSDALARTDIVLSRISKRNPRLGSTLKAFYALIAALLFCALLYGSWGKLADAWSSGEHVGVYGLFVAPVWPVNAVVVLGVAAVFLQFSIHTWSYFMNAATASSTKRDEKQ